MSLRRPVSRDTLLWIAGATAVFVISVLCIAEAFGRDEFWPVAVPGLLTGIGTLVLAGVTAWTLRAQQQDRRRDIDFQRRAQAAKVYVGEPRQGDMLASLAGGQNIYGSWEVEVVNKSDDVISSCVVDLHLSPDLHRGEANPQINLGRILPGNSAVASVPSQPGDEQTYVTAELYFQDASGVEWRRNEQHRLIDVEEFRRAHGD